MANELEQDVADKCLAVNSQKVTNCSLLAHPKKLRENENSRILKTNSPYFTNLATGFFLAKPKNFSMSCFPNHIIYYSMLNKADNVHINKRRLINQAIN